MAIYGKRQLAVLSEMRAQGGECRFVDLEIGTGIRGAELRTVLYSLWTRKAIDFQQGGRIVLLVR